MAPRATKLRTYTPADLEPLRTLCKGQCCDLKREARTQRVWLCRTGGGVTVETRSDRGRWVVTSGGCTATEARGA